MEKLVNDHNREMHLKMLDNLVGFGRQYYNEKAKPGESNEAWNGRSHHYLTFAGYAIQEMVNSKLITEADKQKAIEKLYE